MPAKIVELPQLGTIKLYKRRGTRSIKITITNDDYVRVSLPTWMPYRAGIEFAKTKQAWVSEHKRPAVSFNDGMPIGKSYLLTLCVDPNTKKTTSRINNRIVTVRIKSKGDVNLPETKKVILRAAERALAKEAADVLPQRLNILAKKYNIEFSDVRVKKLRSRWGSCNHYGVITLNIYLMQLPWNLIDYVLLHELTHTKHLHHGKEFWHFLNNLLPESSNLKKEIKNLQPSF